MATSLQRQLAALATPASSILIPERKLSSILFTPQEAAKHKRDVFYEIGCEGLDELIKIDSLTFKKFRTSILFNEASKGYERIVEDKEKNQKLDEVLEEFMISLSPYLMLKASLKCLEWLINRFHIEKFNVDLIMESFIPYYDTKVFSLMIAILDVSKRSNSWQWIIPNIQTSLPVSKADLYSHSSPQFLIWMFSTFYKFIKVHEARPEKLRIFISFMTSTLSGMLNRINTDLQCFTNKSKLTKLNSKGQTVVHCLWSQVALLSTNVKKNLQLKSNEEIQSMIYIICTVLFNLVNGRPQLSRELRTNIRRVMTNILKSHPRSLKTQAYLLLNLLSADPEANIILKKAILLRRALNDISVISSDWDLWYLSSKLIYAAQQKFGFSLSKLWEIVQSIEFTILQRSEILKCIYKFSRCSDSINSSKKSSKQFLTRFEREYPTEFDIACEGDPEFASGLAKITKERNFLVLSQHPDNEIRKEGVRMIIRKFNLKYIQHHDGAVVEDDGSKNKKYKKSGRVSVMPKQKNKSISIPKKLKTAIPDKNQTAEALFPRFNDDNYEIVHLLIKQPISILTKIFTHKTLVDRLISVTHRKDCNKACLTTAILQLCAVAEDLGNSEQDGSLTSKIFVVLIPFLFPTKQSSLKLSIAILTSSFAKRNKFLLKCSEVLKKENVSAKELCDYSYDAITSSLKSEFMFENWGTEFTSETSLVFSILTWKSTDKFNELMNIVENLDCKAVSTSWKLTKQNFSSCIRLAAKTNSVALELVLTTIYNLSLEKFEHIERVTKFLFKNCEIPENRNVCEVFLKDFLKEVFPLESQQLSFWISMIISTNKVVSSDQSGELTSEFLLVRILQCVHNFLKEYVDATEDCSSINEKLGITEVVLTQCVDNASQSVRVWGLDSLQIFSETNSKDADFLTHVLGYRDEIIADKDQAAVVVSKALQKPEFVETQNRFIQIIVEGSAEDVISIGLLKMFRFASSIVFTKFYPLAKELLLVDPDSKKLHAILNCFDGSLDTSSFGILIEAMKYKHACLIVLSKITAAIFDSYEMETKKKLIALLIDVVLFSKIPEVKVIIQRRIRKWVLDASIISAELDKCIKLEKLMSSVANNNAASSRKKKSLPAKDPDTKSAFGNVEWTSRTEVVLEFVQTKKRLKQKTTLIHPLFKLLKTCISLEDQSPVEYLKQLILTTLTFCCYEIDSATAKDSDDWIHFDVETVINCLRCSRNPQTHHHALILLNYAAKKYPEQVLHGVMSLFTFMGNSILRQDDTYSTQLIQQTVTTIIPTLASTTSVRQFSKALVSAGIFRVFTCAVQDIPVHRRLPVFISLVETLDPIDAMWQVCIIVVDNALLRDKKRSHLNADLELATDLVWNFEPNIVLSTMEKVYLYLMSLPIYEKHMTPEKFQRNATTQDPQAKAIIDLSRKETLRDAEIIVLFTIELVSKICGKFAELGTQADLNYDSLLQNCLSLSRLVLSNPEDKILRLIGQRNFEVIEKVNAALEPKDFVTVTIAILARDDTNVKKKILDLLNQRILHQLEWFKDLNVLLELIPHLLQLGSSLPETEEQVTLVQTSFLTLKLIAKYLSMTSPEEFVPVFKLAIEQAKHKNRLLRASALLCLGELFSLKSLILPNLSNVCSSILKAFKASMKLKSKGMNSFLAKNHDESEIEDKFIQEGETSITTATLLCISAMTCFNKLVEQLGPFLGSSFLQKGLLIIFSIDEIFGEGIKSESRKKFDQRLRTLLKTIGTKIPLRNSIGTIKEVITKLEDSESTKNKSKYLMLLVGLLKETLLITSKQDLTTLLPSLCDSFLSHFLLHREKMLTSKEDGLIQSSIEQIEEVESSVLDCLVSGMILKMSEGMFRPFYHKMYDWATDSLPRLITFYRLSKMAAERLKSLFVTFAGFVIHEASKQLEQDSTLTNAILSYFYQIFLHDREGFITIDRFNSLVKPLVDLVESEFTISGEIKIKDLNNTLIQLAVASNDLNRWQHMIDLLSLKTRNANPKVRLFVISTIETAATELGKDFLPLLPPAVPFLAEMLNDDDDLVEKQTRKMLLKLEDLLGEPLQPYFTI